MAVHMRINGGVVAVDPAVKGLVPLVENLGGI